MSDEAKRLGRNLKRIRTKKGISQGDIVRALKMDRAFVSNIENGKFPFSVATFARVSQALGTSANRLLEGLPEPDVARMTNIKKALARKRKPKGM